VHLKVDKIDSTLVCYLRLLIQAESMFTGEQGEAVASESDDADKLTKHSSTNTSQMSASSQVVDEVPDEDTALLNFTKVTDLAQERKMLDLYKALLLYVLKKIEAVTTLEEDLQLLCSNELTDYKMRFAVIYRSERKKIIHSQLHLVQWLQQVLSVCD